MDFLLHADDLTSLQAFLLEKKWIAPAEELLSATKPGEGNMNYVLRIRSNFRTFIVKQSRAYVEKYPQIPAPKERAVIEGQFYELIQEDDTLRFFTPELSYVDPQNSLLVLEDLGESKDFSFLYEPTVHIDPIDLSKLIEFLSVLHNGFNVHFVVPSIRNRAMRELNAEHIFRFPFQEDNGLDLNTITEGLQEVALGYMRDEVLKNTIDELSKQYLSDGDTLLHGDYYPGSWIKTLDKVHIIDPEFCFFGPAEFDLSVMMAHMHLANQSSESIQMIIDEYKASKGFDWHLMNQLQGVEILRRLIGIAQLPLTLSLAEKEILMDKARAMILS